jgi:hypothetical protein
MRLMGWDMDIVHRTNNHLVDADYWSWLESDLCYDPTFRQYLHLVLELRRTHPPPTNLPMKAKNMPYYRCLCIPVKHCPAGTSMDEVVNAEVDAIATALMTTIVTQGDEGLTNLCNCPVILDHCHFRIANAPSVAYTTQNSPHLPFMLHTFHGLSTASTLGILCLQS